MNEKQKRNWRWENWIFSKKNAAENIIQGGYRSCPDTMLGNMTSMDEGEKSYETIVLIVKSDITNEWITH